MKIYLRDQASNFVTLLEEFKVRQAMDFDISKLKERTSIIGIVSDKKIADLNLDFLFDYKIFPTHIMTSMSQWEQEKRKMKIGDTILQQVFIPPTKFVSQKIVFGVRINRIIDEFDKKGFSYETLDGHVEKGESTFTIEKSGPQIIFKIKTFSAPGNFLTRLAGPILAIPYQTYCTRCALNNVKRQIES